MRVICFLCAHPGTKKRAAFRSLGHSLDTGTVFFVPALPVCICIQMDTRFLLLITADTGLRDTGTVFWDTGPSETTEEVTSKQPFRSPNFR